MKMNRLRAFFFSGAALSLSACSGGVQAEQAELGSRFDGVDEARLEASELSAPPRPLTPEVNETIWANLFGGFARAARVEVSEDEREAIVASLEELGIPGSDVSLVGANVFLEDVSFSAEPILERLRSGTVEKGKVLAQIVSQIIGTHDTSLVSPSDVVGASIQYASQPIDDTFLFNRPEVEPGFAHVLVLGDDVPEAIFTAFRDSVAEIGNASEADCLSPTFLSVLSRSEFDAAFPRGPFDVPPRVTEVFYSPEACGGRALGCTQYPRAENVVLSPTSLDGQLGTFQRRVLFGGYIGINSAFITPDSAEFSTLTHELMHAMGIAHPVVERIRSAVAAKLVVPGTEPGDGGYTSIMAFRTTANRSLELSADDVDTIDTLYSSQPGCAYSPQALAIRAN